MAILSPPARRPITREEYDRLAQGPPYFDYVNGELVEVNRPTGRHQDVCVCLTYSLRSHVQTKQLGVVYFDVNVELPAGDIFGPGVVFVTSEHMDIYDSEKGYFRGSPDLIAEATSPSTAAYDRAEKMQKYFDAGIPWLWYIEQDSLAVEEVRWSPEGYLIVGWALPGQSFRPKLFPDLEINLSALLNPASGR